MCSDDWFECSYAWRFLLNKVHETKSYKSAAPPKPFGKPDAITQKNHLKNKIENVIVTFWIILLEW